jgi:hypothetical protein
MKGYIYTMYAGADPGHGWTMNDPIFTPTPTLGACMPNIRRAVSEGDYIFAISGRVNGERQFVVGGFRVAEKIDALAALGRFPQYRLAKRADGNVDGNIIITAQGTHHPLDHHANFERRVENYIVGTDPVYLSTDAQYRRGREETVPILSKIFARDGQKVSEIIGRYRRMEKNQVEQLLTWLEGI